MEILRGASHNFKLHEILKGSEFRVEGNVKDLRGRYSIRDDYLERGGNKIADTIIVQGGDGGMLSLKVHSQFAENFLEAGFTLKQSWEKEPKFKTLVLIKRK